jgi:glycosyltransferase involved in cell wall biosynthesis
MKSICIVVASDMTITAFLMKHLEGLSGRYAVSVVANTHADLLKDSGLPVRVIPVAIRREISLWADLKALWRLWRLFRQERFSSIHSITPKAGLLAMVAGRMARVPVRIHSFSGQVWATRTGLMRRILKAMDRITVRMATHLISDSQSQIRFLRDEGIVGTEEVHVPANGSISGVDLERFRPDPEIRTSVRRQLGLADDALVFLFLGRLKRDKGVIDLAHAFQRVAAVSERQVSLLIVGPDEDGLLDELRAILDGFSEQVRILPYTEQPERSMMASDVFCLPSYRESFGITVVEAAACGVPAIGSRIYGVTDAIVEHETGCLYTVGDVDDLVQKMMEMLDDKRRLSMGERARERAVRDFSDTMVTAAWLAYYEAAV